MLYEVITAHVLISFMYSSSADVILYEVSFTFTGDLYWIHNCEQSLTKYFVIELLSINLSNSEPVIPTFV